VKYILILAFLVSGFAAIAQDTLQPPAQLVLDGPKIRYQVVWECGCGYNSGFPGGVKAFHKFLKQNLNFDGIPGFPVGSEQVVYVSFMVTDDGRIEDVSVARMENKEIIKEIKRVFYDMPIWIPDQYNCENVSMLVRIPIRIIWNETL